MQCVGLVDGRGSLVRLDVSVASYCHESGSYADQCKNLELITKSTRNRMFHVGSELPTDFSTEFAYF